MSIDPPARNVMISSASRKVPLVRSVVEAAQRVDFPAKVFAADADPSAHAQLVADGFIPLPRTDPSNLAAITDLLTSHHIATVIPTRDGELMFWAEHREHFAGAGIDVVVSPPETIATTLDKRAFSDHGRRHGLPIVPVRDQVDPDDPGPFVVKERLGAGSRSIGLDLNGADALAHARLLEDPIIQPHVSGLESSADAWFDRDGNLKGMVLRRRAQVVNGESVVTTTFRDDALATTLREVTATLRFRGPVVIQVIVDAHGAAHVIEINSRFGGASTTSIAAGLDLWYWTLLDSAGYDTATLPFARVAGEIQQVRVPSDLHFEVQP